MTADLIVNQTGFDALVDQLCAQPCYALDTEFVREKTYFAQVALVQVAWRPANENTKVALVDPLELDLTGLARLMQSDAVAIVHAASQDLEILENLCGHAPRRLFDPQIAAAFLGFGTASLGNLLTDLLGVKMSKAHQLTDWLRRPLSSGALRYAADDVAHLIDLRDSLRARLSAAGRLEWATEECEAMRVRDRSRRDPDTAWHRLKGRRKLNVTARAIAQTLAAWRERRAQELNRPVKTVLSDFAILGIAQNPPSDLRDFERIRGLQRSIRPKLANELLAQVEKGRALPTSEIVNPPKGPSDKANPAAVTLCVSWATQVARDNELEPSILATRDDVSNLVRGRASRLDHGWRFELLGRDLRALCAGQRGLHLAEGRLELSS